MNVLFSEDEREKKKQHKQKQMGTDWDVSAALVCKQFLEHHFLLKVWKETTLNKLQQMRIVTVK